MSAALQRLRAEVRFDRAALDLRLAELQGIRLDATTDAYAAEFDPERLAWLRDVLLGAAPRLVHELAALDALLAEVAAVSTDPRG